jgi:hypothetical protein
VIAEPPFEGAIQLTVACPFPGVADTCAGAAGTVAGVTELDAAEAGPVPTAFFAVTTNVYAVPFVNPPIITPVAGGEPVTDVGACADVPMYGVTV